MKEAAGEIKTLLSSSCSTPASVNTFSPEDASLSANYFESTVAAARTSTTSGADLSATIQQKAAEHRCATRKISFPNAKKREGEVREGVSRVNENIPERKK